jgi:hypothetical protein
MAAFDPERTFVTRPIGESKGPILSLVGAASRRLERDALDSDTEPEKGAAPALCGREPHRYVRSREGPESALIVVHFIHITGNLPLAGAISPAGGEPRGYARFTDDSGH